MKKFPRCYHIDKLQNSKAIIQSIGDRYCNNLFDFPSIVSVAVVSGAKRNPNLNFTLSYHSKCCSVLVCILTIGGFLAQGYTPVCLEICLCIHCQARFCFFNNDQILVQLCVEMCSKSVMNFSMSCIKTKMVV